MSVVHSSHTLLLPHWRAVARHALPNVVQGKLIPVLLFVVTLRLAGTTAALLAALVWSVGALWFRRSRGKAASGILVLTTVALAARTVAAIATGSLFVYFLQPTLTTCLVGLAFLVSVPLGRPLAERVAMDLCPMDDETRAHPSLRRFFHHASLWWAFTSMVNFGITVWLLVSQSPTTFVLVKSALGPTTTAVTLAVAFVWFRALMARSGTRVAFAHPPVAVGTPSAFGS